MFRSFKVPIFRTFSANDWNQPALNLFAFLSQVLTPNFSSNLDFDDAGKKEYSYWQQSFPNLEPWPVPDEKSTGDYFAKGFSLRAWILAGMKTLLRLLDFPCC